MLEPQDKAKWLLEMGKTAPLEGSEKLESPWMNGEHLRGVKGNTVARVSEFDSHMERDSAGDDDQARPPQNAAQTLHHS